MFATFEAPVKNAKLYHTGWKDLIKHLELHDLEVMVLVESLDIDFDFWYKGKSHENSKKWTTDGFDGYADFSLRNYFLACICDMYKGAKCFDRNDIVMTIEAIPGLRKWIHFSEDRVTIKDMYFGQWKNFWKFR